MKFEYKESEFEPLPVGGYQAIYQGAEEFDGDKKYGDCVRLKFLVVGGDHDGQETDVLCAKKLTSKSKLTKFVIGLKGSGLKPGDVVDLDDFKGTNCMINVGPKEKGDGTTINSVVKMHQSS